MTDGTAAAPISGRIAIERWEGEGGRAPSWDEIELRHDGGNDEGETSSRADVRVDVPG